MNKRSILQTITRSKARHTAAPRHFVYILSGLPCIGKSQRADWWQRENGWTWIEFDRHRHFYTGSFDDHSRDHSHVYPKILLDVEDAVERQAKYIILDGRNANYDTIGYLSVECREIFKRHESLPGRFEIHWCLFENNVELAIANERRRFDRTISADLIRKTSDDLKQIRLNKLMKEGLIDSHLSMQGYRDDMKMRGFM